jgi:hypothetical protein
VTSTCTQLPRDLLGGLNTDGPAGHGHQRA